MVNKSLQPSGWVGWIYFTSAMLLIAGGIGIIAGLTGIFNSDFYALTESGYLIAFDYTTWGWITLMLGLLMIAAAVSLAVGKTWARVLAFIVVIMAAIGNVATIDIYPLWSIAALIINGLAIYAITVHGSELKEN